MMTQTRGFVVIGSLILLAVLLAGVQFSNAQTSSAPYSVPDRYGLKGLKGFYVQVDNIPYDVEGWGLTKADIQRDVELQLRKGGALILTREQAADTPAAPRLHVRLMASKQHNSPYYNYCVVVNFSQGATLTRDPAIVVDATTWSKAGLGMIKKKELKDVREVIAEIVDAFLNAYLAENPKV